MPAITIKNIPEELYQAIKKTAESHHRSINSEVIVRLKQVLLPSQVTPSEKLSSIQKLRSQVKPNIITEVDIENAINEGRP